MRLAARLDFKDATGAVSFNLTPASAVQFFQAKGLKPTFAWQDMLAQEHQKAFTVAKMLDLDLLADVQRALDKAIAEGQTFGAFRQQLQPLLEEKGWWGKQPITDPKTGVTSIARLGTPARLQTIYRTNIQASYAVGHWHKVQVNQAAAPLLMYDAVDDHRTRPEHARLDGLLLPVSHPFWKTHAPPNGWNCRCGVIQMTQREARDLLGKSEPDEAPRITRRPWVNPRTGKVHQVPTDLDPGWDYNPGDTQLSELEQMLREKIAALPASLRKAAAKAPAAADPAALAAAGQAFAAEAAAFNKAASVQAVAKAQAELAQIAADSPPYLGAALKKVSATKAGAAMTAPELLAAVTAQAAKDKSAALLANYKQKVLQGKAPNAAQVAALEALDEADQATFLAALQAEVDLAEALADPKAAVKFTPSTPKPTGALHGVKWQKAKPAEVKAGVMPDLVEPPLSTLKGKKKSAGVIMIEDDGRVWVFEPKNHYKGTKRGLPKGNIDAGETAQEAALREVFEETGLRAQITGVVGDVKGKATVTRFYVGKRVGGLPQDMGNEAWSVRLLPAEQALEELTGAEQKAALAHALKVHAGEQVKPLKVYSKAELKARAEAAAAARLVTDTPPELSAAAAALQPVVDMMDEVGLTQTQLPVHLYVLRAAAVDESLSLLKGLTSAQAVALDKAIAKAWKGLDSTTRRLADDLVGEMLATGDLALDHFDAAVDMWKGVGLRRYLPEAPALPVPPAIAPVAGDLAPVTSAAKTMADDIADAFYSQFEGAPMNQAGKDAIAALPQGVTGEIVAQFSKVYGAQGTKDELAAAILPILQRHLAATTKAAARAPVPDAKLAGSYLYKVQEGLPFTRAEEAVYDALPTTVKQKIEDAWVSTSDWTPDTLAEVVEQALGGGATAQAPGAIAVTRAAVSGNAPALDFAKFRQIGGQGGSNPGGLYEHVDTGERWYIKTPQTDDHARNEALAAALYRAIGVDAPDVVTLNVNGRLGVASKIVDGAEKKPAALKAGTVQGAADGFVADAWLANWDVVGLSFDNMLVANGKAIRLDTGGALLYRAQGGAKGAAFGTKVAELDTLRDAAKNPQAAAVFKHVGDDHLKAGAERLSLLDDAKIRSLVDELGPGDAQQRAKLADTLIARKADILARVGLDEAKLAAAKAEAIADAKMEVEAALSGINGQFVEAIKGIAFRASKGEALAPQDITRAQEVREAFDAFLASDAAKVLTQGNLDELRAFYTPWLDDLAAATQAGVGAPAAWGGGFFSGFTGQVLIDAAKVKPRPPRVAGAMTDSQILDAFKKALKIDAPAMTDGPTFARLTDIERGAIHRYTQNYYAAINSPLRKSTKDEKWLAVRDAINQALAKATPYKGKATRGMHLNGPELEAFLKLHRDAMETGGTVRYRAFTSSTKGDSAAFGGNIKVVLHSKTGVHVKPLSAYKNENEVLFPAGAEFMVDDVRHVGGNQYEITVREV